ncbi:hypothetical protein DFR74_1083 [Nocardia puris]|uniref:Uncharacterized protein n=1 Tax=Nocardia puris TaxID=208602 RepID=A0A366DGX8_9NOCA|nr:hypothetical protein DFR74_1083 [Nocardia puris]
MSSRDDFAEALRECSRRMRGESDSPPAEEVGRRADDIQSALAPVFSHADNVKDMTREPVRWQEPCNRCGESAGWYSDSCPNRENNNV